MLKDSFYTISEITSGASSLTASLQLHQAHPLYQGHFPGQPVVPGVCMMQMVKELTQLATNQRLRLQRADSMKFLQVVDPRQTGVLRAELNYTIADDGTIKVSAIFLKETTSFFKFKGMFRSAE
jgi:3-hydroxyacyl-[acyl-carrier-protein] dehydratase